MGRGGIEAYRPFIECLAGTNLPYRDVFDYHTFVISDRLVACEVETVLADQPRYRGLNSEEAEKLFVRHLREKSLIPALLSIGTEDLGSLTIDGEFTVLHILSQVDSHVRDTWANFQLTTPLAPNGASEAMQLSLYNPYREDPAIDPEVKAVVEKSKYLFSSRLGRQLEKVKEHFQNRLQKDPSQIRNIFAFLDAWYMSDLHDEVIDWVLGIDEAKIDTGSFFNEEGEQTDYEGSYYSVIRDFLGRVDLKDSDVVYDLGSGLGRVVLYGALTRGATFKGIELVEERVQQAEGIREHFGIENAQFIHGNVLDQDLSDGNIFFMFNPFSSQPLEKVIGKLYKISLEKKIYIVSWAGSNLSLEKQPWLRDIDDDSSKIGSLQLRIFESSWPHFFFSDRMRELASKNRVTI